MPSVSHVSSLLDYENPVSLSPTQVETIAIIGGGASAAIILDCLLKEPDSKIKLITIFERQPKLGGIWYYNPETIQTPNDIIKSGNSDLENDPQLENPFHIHKYTRKILLPKSKQERFVQTPSYHGMTTNIIEQLMTYSDVNQWSTDDTEKRQQQQQQDNKYVVGTEKQQQQQQDNKYVVGTVVQKYIEKYIHRNLDNPKFVLRLNSTVEDVERIDRHDSADIPYRFTLTIRTFHDEKQDLWYQQDFDSIVVASGHYHVPFIPHVPGLKQVQKKYPQVVQHAKFYRDSQFYENKTVIVVGSRASGSDLTKFVAREPNTKVYQSIRNFEKTKVRSNRVNAITKPPIKDVQVSDSDGIIVTFEDGTTIENPNHIIYCTGYSFSYPFLNRFFNNAITNKGVTVNNLYQHTFLVSEPLITIIGVPIDGISFRVFEYQAILLSRYLTGKVQLPSRSQQLEWVQERFEAKQNTRSFHTIGAEDALNYVHTLTNLGNVSKKCNLGREFPTLTADDVLMYKQAGEKLKKFWDER
ncbi:hypothetical protein KGF56_000801 [Candida oxycetoniae]|uniref:Thiol-specific monooxygenase n=1 Tax=Candida oxycetoniae TaxID=497107 RepID=A0AAI9T0R3_9ASCO|nr:uncharacterized protein KGF56_000801 [Candida oxycetoniae]KAI3406320.2 hypothetical protein KGF56_000801 [Candida oxycetoniae]